VNPPESGDPQPDRQPLLKVIKGDPSPEELAALVAVISSMGTAEPAAERRTPEWSAPHRQVRDRYFHGPGGWRSSGLPR
jgi:hypothetical protein